ncbi:CPBP family intramembrane glutamic endopeptidase [Gemelliphila palaticanis]|uniref:CPBP family intramembrane metalloprotease n=1 Tax=Gemelliphila palaticanis TaxID=81950 RepID=A0ABX2SXS6_9BACL|nr:type II CAAX endopeptidase family protein [Gemella palaticanis]MBF0715050.1 CPBP family intramembrane metalloprotease [Gemella palaticanis]NYS46980.1 CPBP family intramembrane metalloprotease [Gemella palaticanis]
MKINFKNGRFIPLIIIVLIYISGLIFIPYFTNKLFSINNTYTSIIISLSSNIISLIAILLYVSRNKINNMDKVNKMPFIKSVFWGIIGFFALIILQMILGIILYFLSKIYGFDYTSQNTAFLSKIVKAYPVYLIMPIIFAPIAEEIVFRKAIFGYFNDILYGTNNIVKFLLSGVLTGIIFGLPHDGFSPLMIVYIIMSLVFSGLYTYTKNIVTPITAHLLMNTAVMLAQIINN